MTSNQATTDLAKAQEELARRTHTLDLCRQELGGTREEADRFAAELRQTREQRDDAQRLHGMWKKSAEDRLGDLVNARDEIQRQDALLAQAYDHNTETQDERDRLAAELTAAQADRDEHHRRIADLIRQRDQLAAERDQLVLDLGNMRGIARGNKRHVAILAAILEAVEQAEPKMHLRQDGNCWPDCPGCLARAALNTSVTEPVPGYSPREGGWPSSPRAPEPTDVTIRGVRVFLPDERRCADPDRPVRIVVAGVAYSDLNADEAREIAAALVAAAGESQASEPAARRAPEPDSIAQVRARVRDLEQLLIAAAPAADNAHRQLRAIREARTHTCDRHCTEGGCDFDLGGFVDRVDEILAAGES